MLVPSMHNLFRAEISRGTPRNKEHLKKAAGGSGGVRYSPYEALGSFPRRNSKTHPIVEEFFPR